jgi:hypothetical protein
MANPKKFKFELNGMTFELPTKHLQTEDWSGKKLENPIIRINQAAGAALCKQYVKKMYPEVVVSVSSDSFSMGNSVSVYISDEYGAEVRKDIIEDVQSFGDQFVYGKFNGMIDMYEMRGGTVEKTDSGTQLDAGVKFLHVNNRPKHASLPDVVRMLCEMTTTEKYNFGKLSITEAVKKAKYFGANDNNINKALKMLA